MSELSFEVFPADCLLVRGPNGIGKTTLLRTLAGIGNIANGSLSIREGDIAFLGHGDPTNDELTVQESFDFWMSVFGVSNCCEQLHLFDLDALGNTQVKMLSAGQRRRLSVATTTSLEKSIWLLDEPTNSLDSGARMSLRESIRRQRANGGAVVLTAHDGFEIEDATHLDLSCYRFRGKPVLQGRKGAAQ